MAQSQHPDKEVRRAIEALVAAGWRIVRPKGRTGHAWGIARCPRGHRECSKSISATPANSGNEARRLLSLIEKCERRTGQP